MSTDAPSKPRQRRRQILLLAMLVVAIGLIVATDDGELDTMVRCFGRGQGFAWVPEEREPFTTDFYGFEYSGHTRELIDMSVYYFGAYEKPVLFLLRDIMKATASQGDGVFVDVGANVGQHSMFMSLHADTVHAIEPFPPVLDRMRSMIARNDIDNVVVHPVGLSNEPGSLPFYAPDERNMGSGSFARDFEEQAPSDELPLVTGDSLLAEAGVERVDLFKIDIEGFEKNALQGLEETLERDRPVVFFEMNVHNDEGFHGKDQLLDVFPYDYEFYEFVFRKDLKWKLPGGELMCGHSLGHYRLKPYPMDFRRSSVNVVAAPAEKAARIPKQHP